MVLKQTSLYDPNEAVGASNVVGMPVERLRSVVVEFTEVARERDERAWIELLCGKHQHEMFEPCTLNDVEVGRG